MIRLPGSGLRCLSNYLVGNPDTNYQRVILGYVLLLAYFEREIWVIFCVTILLDVVLSTINKEQVSIPCVAIISRFKVRTYRFTVDHVVVNAKKIHLLQTTAA